MAGAGGRVNSPRHQARSAAASSARARPSSGENGWPPGRPGCAGEVGAVMGVGGEANPNFRKSGATLAPREGLDPYHT